MAEENSVLVDREGVVTIISINRPERRNAVDGATARKLYDAFLAFDADSEASVAVFTGTGGHFCAGADLKKVAAGDLEKKREIGGFNSIAPMGPSRLRLIGHSQAMDLILTGRPVEAHEAHRMGLANRVVGRGEACAQAIALAQEIARFPQTCLRADRLSALQQWDLPEEEAIKNEMRGGLGVIASGETLSGATRFASGVGKHGAFSED